MTLIMYVWSASDGPPQGSVISSEVGETTAATVKIGCDCDSRSWRLAKEDCVIVQLGSWTLENLAMNVSRPTCTTGTISGLPSAST